MQGRGRFHLIGFLMATGLVGGGAFAEEIDLVTYYPAPSTPDLHTRSLTVGTQYATATPNDGQAFIFDSLGIGTTNPLGPLHVVGFNDQLSSVIFEPGQDTGAAGVPDIRMGIGSGFTAGNPPTQRLEVKGNVYANGGGTGTALFMANRSDNVNFFSGLQLLTAGALKWTIGSRNNATEDLQIYSDADSAIRLSIQQGTGHVGIGTTAPASTLQVEGSLGMAVAVVYESVALNKTHNIVLCNNGSPMTVNLPAAAQCAGRTYYIKKVSTTGPTVTIDPNGAEGIDGEFISGQWVVRLFVQNDAVRIVSNGANWDVISDELRPHRAQLIRVSAQTINSSPGFPSWPGFTRIDFESIRYDNAVISAVGGFVIRRAGKYLITFHARASASCGDGQQWAPSVFVNGALMSLVSDRSSTSNGVPGGNIAIVLDLSAESVVQAGIWPCVIGQSTSTVPGEQPTLSIAEVRP